MPKVFWVTLACCYFWEYVGARASTSPFGATVEACPRKYSRVRRTRERGKELYYFRDQQGLEVDFSCRDRMLGYGSRMKLENVRSAMAAPLSLYAGVGETLEGLIIVHRKSTRPGHRGHRQRGGSD